jgi:hypothetical protein
MKARWRLAGAGLGALVLGIGAFFIAAVHIWLPLQMAPAGWTLEELRAVGAAIQWVPFDAVLACVFAAIALAFILVGLLARRTSTPSRFISTGLFLIVAMLIALYPLWWGAAFGTADYFAEGGMVPIDQVLPILGFMALVAAIALRVASRGSRPGDRAAN